MAELLDVETVTEPFDLQTALRYMDENGEFIRFKNDTVSIHALCERIYLLKRLFMRLTKSAGSFSSSPPTSSA